MLVNVHSVWGWVVVVSNGLAGLWALAAHWLVRLRGRPLWVFTAFAQVAISVQVTIGAILIGALDRAAPSFHVFYGFVALMAVGIIYSYRQQVQPYVYLLYGGGGLFLMGLALRSMFIHG